MNNQVPEEKEHAGGFVAQKKLVKKFSVSLFRVTYLNLLASGSHNSDYTLKPTPSPVMLPMQSAILVPDNPTFS
jgi:hypothetical protein